jgi:hypothetical protein
VLWEEEWNENIGIIRVSVEGNFAENAQNGSDFFVIFAKIFSECAE